MKAAIVILAAGASTRMGQSKQLLKWSDQTLLNHTIDTALSTAASVTVVLGANEQTHKEAIKGKKVSVVVNSDWQSGMGSSLKAGVRSLSKDPDAVIVMVCDQPYVSKEHLIALWNEHQKTGKAVA